MDQGTAQSEFLLHAARQLSRRPVGKGSKPGTFQEKVNPFGALLPVLSKQATEEVDVLEDG